jgi:hypothetical protein
MRFTAFVGFALSFCAGLLLQWFTPPHANEPSELSVMRTEVVSSRQKLQELTVEVASARIALADVHDDIAWRTIQNANSAE